MTFDIDTIRQQFPAIDQGKTIYLDSAATSQKPQIVIDTMNDFYQSEQANVHRGQHSLTAQTTFLYEQARQTVQLFLNAAQSESIIWTKGTTEAINLLAHAYAKEILHVGDEILVGEMEHHANIVPWQIIANQTGAKVIKVPMTNDCQWDMNAYQNLLSSKTKIVAAAHVTNVTGTRQPIEQIIQLAHQFQAICIIDGAQGILHEPVDVQALDCDFYVFSGHKLYAPLGVGVLYGKKALLEGMSPWQGGGKMVEKVSFTQTSFAKLPYKLEAGTPNTASIIGLKVAIDWFLAIGYKNHETHIQALYQALSQGLEQIQGVQIIGHQKQASLLSFVAFDDDTQMIHHQDLAALLDEQHIIVRSGHHCAHPIMDRLQIEGTIRVSLGIYNQHAEIESFLKALEKSLELLR